MENLGFSADVENDDQVRVLTLNKGEHQDGNLYKLKKGTYCFATIINSH